MKTGWETRKIEDVCEVIPGQSPNSRHYNQEANGLPFYQGKREFTNRVLGQPTKWTTFVTKKAIAGDIVMSVRAPVGPVNEVIEPICIGRGLATIRSGDKIEKDFLWYFLLSIQSEIEGKDGAVFPSINRQEIESIELMLPPLEEQQRIVKILDEAFAGLETARSNIAVNLESSKELFQSVLDESLSGAEEKGWEDRKIEDVCEVISGQSPNGRYYNQEANGLPFYQGKKEFTDRILGQPIKWTTFVTKEAVAGDIVMSVRAPVGPVNEVSERICIGRGLAAIRSGDEIKKDFLWYVLLNIQNEIECKDGAVFPSINRQEIESIKLMLPTSKEQQNIVEKLDTLQAQTIRLQQEYTTQLAGIDELRQSLLQKAFAGELT